jgi:hypothetical protein
VHKALKLSQSLLQGFIVNVINISDEIEVFLRGEEVDEESAVDVTAEYCFRSIGILPLHEKSESIEQFYFFVEKFL